MNRRLSYKCWWLCWWERFIERFISKFWYIPHKYTTYTTSTYNVFKCSYRLLRSTGSPGNFICRDTNIIRWTSPAYALPSFVMLHYLQCLFIKFYYGITEMPKCNKKYYIIFPHSANFRVRRVFHVEYIVHTMVMVMAMLMVMVMICACLLRCHQVADKRPRRGGATPIPPIQYVIAHTVFSCRHQTPAVPEGIMDHNFNSIMCTPSARSLLLARARPPIQKDGAQRCARPFDLCLFI